nr:MAG TPA: hypothetical protein [Caudoviricetes sp.]
MKGRCEPWRKSKSGTRWKKSGGWRRPTICMSLARSWRGTCGK